MWKVLFGGVAGFAMLLPLGAAKADELVTEMFLVSKDGVGKSIGTVTVMDSDNGLVLLLDLSADLSTGPHGFHLHTNGSCEPAEKDGEMVAALSAGGHYDPADTGKHLGPSGEGHLGDLPIIYVGADEDGALPVKHALVAPRVKVSDARGRSFMIHQGGDNYRDEPKPLGGGGARVACGVVPE